MVLSIFARSDFISEMATSEIFHVVPRVKLVTLRLLEGCIVEVNTIVVAPVEVVSDFPSSFWGSLSIFPAPPCGSVPVCLPPGA